MKFQTQYELPQNEVPAAVVNVVGTKSGTVYVVNPGIQSMGVISLLVEALRAQVELIGRMEKEAESRIVQPNMAMVPIKRNGNGNGH